MRSLPNPIPETRGTAVRPASRTALAIGTVGRLGEALVNALLESAEYAAVHVAVGMPLRSTLPRLRPWRIDPAALERNDSPAAAMPPVDDVYCCIDGSRSHFGRDLAYFPLPARQVTALGRLAAQSGARRLILLSPLPAFLQLSAAGATHPREIDLVGLGFETLVIVRPTADYRATHGSTLARLIAWGARAAMEIVIPQGLQPLRAHDTARASIAAAALGAGVHVLDPERIRALGHPANRPDA